MSKICGACDTRHYINEDCPNQEPPQSNEFLLDENRKLKDIVSFMVNKVKELEAELAEYRAKAKRPPWD